jgi:hypothetical protein
MFNSLSQIPSSLDGIFLKKPARRCVSEFGLLISGLLILIAIYKLYNYSQVRSSISLFVIGGIVILLSRYLPISLFHLWRIWMMLALCLSKLMMPVILLLMWLCAVVPTSLILKLIGKKIIDTSFRDESVESYFKQRDPKLNDFKLLKWQF